MTNEQLYKRVANYKGPKVGLVITGGGIGLAQIAATMGASNVLHAIHIPYSQDATHRWITRAIGSDTANIFLEKAVSKRSAEILCEAGLSFWHGQDCRVIAVTAALTTNRYRRGLNQAWIANGQNLNDMATHHLELPKIESREEYENIGLDFAAKNRAIEDQMITDYVLNLIFDEIVGDL